MDIIIAVLQQNKLRCCLVVFYERMRMMRSRDVLDREVQAVKRRDRQSVPSEVVVCAFQKD